MTQYGIDISHFQTPQDFTEVRGNGIEFMWNKATEGTTFQDSGFLANVSAAKHAGIRVSGYHFAHSGNTKAQVSAFVARLKDAGLLDNGNLYAMLDVEDAGLQATANGFIHEFIGEFRDQTGQHGIVVYANLDWWLHVLDPAQWADDDVVLMVARFNGDPGNPGWAHPRLGIHQHSSTGTVPGIPGNVDRDCTMAGWTVDMFTNGHAGAPQPAPAPAPAPAPVPAPPANRTYTVRSGDTLSGIGARFGCSWQLLATLNGLKDPNRIYAGQVLKLPGSSVRTVTVHQGDTLSGIAARNGTTWQALATLNGLRDPNKIFPGETLRLP
jgi:LysM repeat protein/GH25 family lysozyme M1 (1,4-beta-N-acetylmuramidase)